MLLLLGAVGGAAPGETADALHRQGHETVNANSRLPIKGSPGYRERMHRLEPVVLEGAEERLRVMQGWLASGDLPVEDVPRARYQAERLAEDLKCARVWAAFGVEFGEPVDDLFRSAKLPVGWTLRASPDHAMYSNLLDDRGRKRATIFSKSAFYDRDAFMSVTGRFSIWRDFEDEHVVRCFVRDATGDVEVFAPEPRAHRRPGPTQQDALLVYYKELEVIEQELRAECVKWLDERYPNSSDPAAHWDDE
jgi:hypothetical protein